MRIPNTATISASKPVTVRRGSCATRSAPKLVRQAFSGSAAALRSGPLKFHPAKVTTRRRGCPSGGLASSGNVAVAFAAGAASLSLAIGTVGPRAVCWIRSASDVAWICAGPPSIRDRTCGSSWRSRKSPPNTQAAAAASRTHRNGLARLAMRSLRIGLRISHVIKRARFAQVIWRIIRRYVIPKAIGRCSRGPSQAFANGRLRVQSKCVKHKEYEQI